MGRLRFWFFLLLFIVSCSDTPTQVVVLVDAPSALRSEIDNVRLDIFSVEGEGGSAEYTPVGSVASAVSEWPMRHVLTPAGGDASRRYLVRVSGRRGFGVVARGSVQSGYLSGQTGFITAFVDNRCRGVCEVGQTCVVVEALANQSPVPYEQCIAVADVEPSSTLPNPDASVDAPDAADAGDTDTMPQCVSNQPCLLPGDTAEEDGTPCANGVTVCVAGVEVCDPIYTVGEVCGGEGTCNPRVCELGNAACPADPSPGSVEGTNQGCMEGEFCFGGTCSACVPGGDCRTPCGTGVWQCGTAPTCAFTNVVPDGTPCAEGAEGFDDACSIGPVCQGGVCQPARRTQEAGEAPILCRPAATSCDAPEYCRADSFECPHDLFQDVGAVCGTVPDGTCQADPVCDENGQCQDPWKLPEGSICGPPAGLCRASGSCGDRDGMCNGADDKALNGTSCGDGGTCNNGVCEIDEECSQPGDCMIWGRNENGECAPLMPHSDGYSCSVEGAESSECTAGTCQNGTCTSTDGIACGSDSDIYDCRAPMCQGGRCVDVMLDAVSCNVPNAQNGCAAGMCDQGDCEPVNGTPCGTDNNIYDCQTPTCQGGQCEATNVPDGQSCELPVATCGDNGRGQCNSSGTCTNEPAMGMCTVTRYDLHPGCYTTACSTAGECDVQMYSTGHPCSNGDYICGDGKCEAPATPVFSRVWAEGSGLQRQIYFEVYNPTNRTQDLRVVIDSSAGASQGGIELGAHHFATIPGPFEVFQASINARLSIDEGGPLLDQLVFSENRDGQLIQLQLPIERKACAWSTVGSMADPDLDGNAGNGFNPPGWNDYQVSSHRHDRGAWLYLGENVTLGRSGPNNDYTEIPNCSPNP